MSDVTCSWPGCDRSDLVARGLCTRCYVRAKRSGNLSKFKLPDRVCSVCGQMFEVSKHRRMTCSAECAKALPLVAQRRERELSKLGRECEFCLEPIPVSSRRDARFCSVQCQQGYWYLENAEELRIRAREWATRNEGKVRAYRHFRRAQMYAAGYERFDAWEIGERDGWVCALCGCDVDKLLAYPDRFSKSIDHVVPLSKGGSHTRHNVAITHLVCNMKKKDRVGVSFKGVIRPSALAS